MAGRGEEIAWGDRQLADGLCGHDLFDGKMFVMTVNSNDLLGDTFCSSSQDIWCDQGTYHDAVTGGERSSQ